MAGGLFAVSIFFVPLHHVLAQREISAYAMISNEGEPLAQLVEHNTFNVGVMGSSPMRLTDDPKILYSDTTLRMVSR